MENQKAISGDRIAHMHGVAEYMRVHAEEHGLPKNEMYLLGLLHDIGYLLGKEEHEKNGADFLTENGFPLKYVSSIRMHGKSLNDPIVDGHWSAETLLLIEADLHVDLSGENVGYDKRLEGIAKRHGKDSKAYCICAENVEWLRKHGRM